ncbi:N-acyl-phosphatidylethanolamine-hydrolyzing phospholipase D [Stereum hirsutum FP-91666 SS1]|uniref:N-acyl-phosphatidylethanolamine-hydrolyzing phospholipase D n=1 Tax=Stereum hirsutum (strain FP-91666) TaxID=721885 RepID=UPI000444A26E|nr:N-acyl-phosphatidylethanolamine-hydrolyzing phospholipase D [Stereum hirsutum FP-91666 SS1]EIM81772.1 N-acyl-phosphatidylethanolamine-hydrolyzing phospholipase D [Stereum hirsutum FP-91666 SS1]
MRCASPSNSPNIATSATVIEPPRRFPSGYVNGKRPAHHLNDSKSKFHNPWPSFRYQSTGMWIDMIRKGASGGVKIPEDVKDHIPTQVPTWGTGKGNEEKAKATWLGHACYLLELPTPPNATRGPRIIFDPVFSNRCSPVQWGGGPPRFTDAPCKIEDVPDVDMIVLSHNHYDHTDLPTLRSLCNPTSRSTAPHVFVPLSNGHLMQSSLSLPASRVHEMDWWDERLVKLTTADGQIDAQVRITCTPSQHTSGRTGFDRWSTLWGAYVIEELLPPSSRVGKKVYFAGDTGYKTVHVHKGEKEDDPVAREVCPAFKEVGERFGGVDGAMLPIGAYHPREMWSNLHASPADAVRMLRDVKGKKGLAMHWGTWQLTSEPVLEPPVALKEEREKLGMREDEFVVPGLGETVFF